MDIERFNKILQSLNGLGIKEGGFFVQEEESGEMVTSVGGMSEDHYVGLHTVIDDIGLDHSMGVLSVLSVLNRLALFDLEKVGCEFNESESHYTSIKLKEGRRKALINTTDPTQLRIPSQMMTGDLAVGFTLAKEYVDYMSKAIASIRRVPGAEGTEIRFASDDGESVMMTISGGGDDFSEPLDSEETVIPAKMEVAFEAEGIQRTLKEAIKASENGECSLILDADGNAHIEVGELEAIVIPVSSQFVPLDEDEEVTDAA